MDVRCDCEEFESSVVTRCVRTQRKQTIALIHEEKRKERERPRIEKKRDSNEHVCPNPRTFQETKLSKNIPGNKNTQTLSSDCPAAINAVAPLSDAAFFGTAAAAVA